MTPNSPPIGTQRVEAFSDAVIAIIMTIMVLELHVPEGTELTALWSLWPVALSYVLSFVYLGIYWKNHHDLLYATERVSGGVLWANLYLLFWLSLIPFVTGWMGENSFTPIPTALYGGVLVMASIAYWILTHVSLATHDEHSLPAKALSMNVKGNASIVLNVSGIVVAFIEPWMAGALYAAVAVMWLIPDRRIERALGERGPASGG